MKVTPIASGGSPSTNLADHGTPGKTATAEKLSIAKAIAAGEKPIRVSQPDRQAERTQESIRRIKMKTNRSPERYEQEEERVETAPVAAEAPITEEPSAITDTTVQADPAIEATKPLSPQFAALAKERRAIQKERAQLAADKAALETSKVPQDLSGYVSKADLLAKPLSVLQEHGVTYDQLTEAILSNQSGVHDPEIQSLKAELKALKEGVDKNFTDRDAQAEQQVLSELKREASLLAKADDTYELIRATDSVPEVIDLIHRTYKQTGEVLDVTDAMQMIEDELIKDAERIARLKKVQGRLSNPQGSVQQPQQVQQGMKTLTNRDGATVPMSRKARAFAAFHGTLKK